MARPLQSRERATNPPPELLAILQGNGRPCAIVVEDECVSGGMFWCGLLPGACAGEVCCGLFLRWFTATLRKLSSQWQSFLCMLYWRKLLAILPAPQAISGIHRFFKKPKNARNKMAQVNVFDGHLKEYIPRWLKKAISGIEYLANGVNPALLHCRNSQRLLHLLCSRSGELFLRSSSRVGA